MKLLSLFKKRKKRLKHRLEIIQKNNRFVLKGEFHGENFFTNELWAFSREDNRRIKVCEIEPAQHFEYSISMEEMLSLLKTNEETAYDWYLKVKTPYDSLSEAKRGSDEIELFTEKGVTYAAYYIRCGRFQQTSISGIDFYEDKENNSIINYVTTKGNLSVLINRTPETPTRLQIENVKAKDSQMTLQGRMFTRNSVIRDGEILLKGRETGTELVSNQVSFHHLKEEASIKYGLNRYTFEATIDLIKMNQGEMVEEDVYDLYFNLDLHDELEIKPVRIGRPTFKAKLFLKEFHSRVGQEAAIINPYYTFKQTNLSFEVYRYSIENFKYLRRTMRWSWLLRLLHRKKDVWLVGERTYKAQDTGYAFFKYMRMNHPNKNVYYVIDENSPEKRNVEPLGNVLHYKSKEHI